MTSSGARRATFWIQKMLLWYNQRSSGENLVKKVHVLPAVPNNFRSGKNVLFSHADDVIGAPKGHFFDPKLPPLYSLMCFESFQASSMDLAPVVHGI